MFNPQTLLKAGILTSALCFLWYFTRETSQQSESSNACNLTESQKVAFDTVKKLMRFIHQNSDELVNMAKTLRMKFMKEDPIHAGELVIVVLQRDIGYLEDEGRRQLNIDTTIAKCMEELEGTEASSQIAVEMQKFYSELSRGCMPMEPFYELPPGLSPVMLLSIFESMRREKNDNIQRVWDDLGTSEIGQVVHDESYMSRPLLRLSPTAIRMIEGLAAETNEKHVVQFENFFPHGMKSYKDALCAMEAQEGVEFASHLKSIEKVYSDGACDLFDEIINEILKNKNEESLEEKKNDEAAKEEDINQDLKQENKEISTKIDL